MKCFDNNGFIRPSTGFESSSQKGRWGRGKRSGGRRGGVEGGVLSRFRSGRKGKVRGGGAECAVLSFIVTRAIHRMLTEKVQVSTSIVTKMRFCAFTTAGNKRRRGGERRHCAFTTSTLCSGVTRERRCRDKSAEAACVRVGRAQQVEGGGLEKKKKKRVYLRLSIFK